MRPGQTDHNRPARDTSAAVTALVLLLGVAVIVGATILTSAQHSQTGPRSREQAILFTLAGIAQFSTAFFLALFAALRADALLRRRRQLARRRALLGSLAAELALLADSTGTRSTGPAGYRDPLRLTLPAHALASDLLDPGRDTALVRALLHLQMALARYNDLVLTNALILLEGGGSDLTATAADYRQTVDAAVGQVTALLPPGTDDDQPRHPDRGQIGAETPPLLTTHRPRH